MQQPLPLIEIKSEYVKTGSFIPEMPLYYMVIRLRNIRKLISIARKYRYYKKYNRYQNGIPLIQELLLHQPHIHNKTQNRPKLKIPSSLQKHLMELAEIMRQSPLPFPYARQHSIFNDILFHLVSEEVVKKGEGWGCGCFSPFSHALRYKESLKECLVDIANVVYSIQSSAVLMLPVRYYQDNDPDEQRHFQHMTDIGLK